LVVVNKIDKAGGATLPDEIAKYNPLLISVNEKKGVDSLIKKLEELAKEHMEIGSDPVITRDRHRFFLKNTIKALEQFDMRLPPELAAENLRQAATCLGRITGHIDVEDILDDIFSNFCIGK